MTAMPPMKVPQIPRMWMCTASGSPEDEVHRPHQAQSRPQVVELHLLVHAEHGKGHEHRLEAISSAVAMTAGWATERDMERVSGRVGNPSFYRAGPRIPGTVAGREDEDLRRQWSKVRKAGRPRPQTLRGKEEKPCSDST